MEWYLHNFAKDLEGKRGLAFAWEWTKLCALSAALLIAWVVISLGVRIIELFDNGR